MEPLVPAVWKVASDHISVRNVLTVAVRLFDLVTDCLRRAAVVPLGLALSVVLRLVRVRELFESGERFIRVLLTGAPGLILGLGLEQ